MPVTWKVNGETYRIQIDPRATVLDTLRETLHLTGAKKGCDHGQCGACTVHINGRRANSWLLFAAMQQNVEITTIEGLGTPERMHSVQAAFVEHDAYQCGYSTSGQIMSAAAMLYEPWGPGDSDVKEALSSPAISAVAQCGARQTRNGRDAAVARSESQRAYGLERLRCVQRVSHKQWEMVELLGRHGGVVSADTAAIYRQADLVRQMLADEPRGVLPEGIVSPGKQLAEELLNLGASCGAAEIVRMALEQIDWRETNPGGSGRSRAALFLAPHSVVVRGKSRAGSRDVSALFPPHS